MSEPINYISIARKAGALVTGEENAGIAVRTGKAALLILASDASENARSRAENFVLGTDVPMVRVPFSKYDLSSATGKSGCSMAVFGDVGLACSFAAALSAQSDAYSEVSDKLKVRLEREAQRRQKAKAHECSKKLGKRRINL